MVCPTSFPPLKEMKPDVATASMPADNKKMVMSKSNPLMRFR